MFCGCKNLSMGNEKEILLQCSGRQQSLISLQNESDEANDTGGYRETVIGKAIEGLSGKFTEHKKKKKK